jgi:hypothetical protein
MTDQVAVSVYQIGRSKFNSVKIFKNVYYNVTFTESGGRYHLLCESLDQVFLDLGGMWGYDVLGKMDFKTLKMNVRKKLKHISGADIINKGEK